ncbi:Vps54-domain-containing protein [Sporormia fimetaria CBS 119925]|uniref:Vacuolar protein sorting-associated protein 54 n=1 Tax=Sporormia fimetaria CBS 119925 TaxID=1340428 RepID=A0A6A6V6V1_9PLEO|nr:Vps54-domain-containing protein [Sporormia fimetaria CBS 119925]
MTSPFLRSPRISGESFDLLGSPSPQPNQFPFPQHHDWVRRASSAGGRHQPRRGSTASSIHSVGGVLDSSYKATMGSVREQSHNAISTLLQPPIVRTGMLPHTSTSAPPGHRPPSTKDIPPVTLANIPHVEPSAFDAYLSQVGNLYETFQRAKAEHEAISQRQQKETAAKEASTPNLESPATPNLSGLPFSAASTPVPKRRTSGSKREKTAVTPLSTIPSVYFDENFRLENPRTFDIVSERSEVVRPPQPTGDGINANGSLEPPSQPGRKALATNAILQEKLSWYMDTVEIHLINSISSASSSFFAALGSLRELHSEASDSVTKIKAVREDLRKLDEQMAVGGLKLVDMKRRRENLRRLADATDQLQSVVEGLSKCDEVVDNGDLNEAMSRLDTVEQIISGCLDTRRPDVTTWLPTHLPSTLVDLRNLRALGGVAEGIQQLRFRIGHGFEARFLETLLADLRSHIQNVPSKETLRRWVSASQRGRGDQTRPKAVLPAYLNTSPEFRQNLRSTLVGLSGSNHTDQASAAFRDAVVREMKLIIRRYLPSSTDDDAESMTSVSTRSSRAYSQQDKNSILARNLRAMDPEDAEEFFVNIFTDIGEALRRLSVQVKILLDVSSGVTTPPPSSGGLRSPPRTPNIGHIDSYLGSDMNTLNGNGIQEELMHTMDMSSLLGEAVDAAQTQIPKLLRVRSEATTTLPLDRFLRYFNLCRLFADECEAVSGRTGIALKNVVNMHINDFVPKFGDSEKQRLAQAMDADRWDPKDFDNEDSTVLARILGGMTADPPEWHQTGTVLPGAESNENGTPAPATNGSTEEKTKTSIPAIVDEEKYFVSDSSGVALRGIERFETLMATIPAMTPDISASLCEYLKLFNSRLCQLILGAGARQSAGLKNINTKHLAIASQTLSFIIAILPYIRECARRHSSGGRTSLAEFDNVKRLLQDQQVSIHEKLTDILRNRAAVHVQALKTIEWDKDVEHDVSPNIERLAKETVTMHNVITRYFAEIAVRMIMAPVFESYREQLGPVFREAKIKTAPGKARLLRDAKLFDVRLRHINGAGDIGSYLLQLAESKTVAESVPEQTTGENKSEQAAPPPEDESAAQDGSK